MKEHIAGHSPECSESLTSEAVKTEAGKKAYFERYNQRTHQIGRLSSIFSLALMLLAPFAMGLVMGAKPDLQAVGKGYLSVGIVWMLSSFAEFAVYTPLLGAGGTYLAFITGNLINMKIPCAFTARDMVGAKSGSPENEIISTLSIACSSLVTILVLFVGVLLLVPLRPVLELPVLRPAFDHVVPALFGALGYKYFRKNIRLAVWPVVVMSFLFILLPSMLGQVSLMILPSGALSIGLAYLFFRRKRGRPAV